MNDYIHYKKYINLITETSKKIELKRIKKISDIILQTIKKKKLFNNICDAQKTNIKIF